MQLDTLYIGKEEVLEKSPLFKRYSTIRNLTVKLCKPLHTEDFVVQPIIDVSPPKWHLAHSTWFFENFLLVPYKKNYQVFNKQYAFLFNSYYESLGTRVIRGERGNLTRPTVEEVLHYRKYVDDEVLEMIASLENYPAKFGEILELGLNHEQQHQELLITDIKYILGNNPLFPAYLGNDVEKSSNMEKDTYLEIGEGVFEIGFQGNDFCFDNEKGHHKVFLHSFKFLNRLITNGEYLEFVEDKGYQNFKWWLSEGWELVKINDWHAPLYWHLIEGKWHWYDLRGLNALDLNVPVTHISYYEAEAFARWKGKRLLTEFEWETACKVYSKNIDEKANFLENFNFSPLPAVDKNLQLFGDVWEWTNSAYLPYPYYQKAEGALGEYNAKFMINQMVLRGGSCASPKDHVRNTYRNFFHPDKRWQFTGIRLAENI